MSRLCNIHQGRLSSQLSRPQVVRPNVPRKRFLRVVKCQEVKSGSTPQISQEDSKIWQRLAQLKKSGAVFKGKVQEVNNIGVFVDVYGLKGLVPFKELGEDRELVEVDPNKLIGQKVKLRLVEVDQERNRLVLSEKDAALKELCEELKIGDIVEGTISYIQDYGAFVALNDKNGNQTKCQALIHRSQLSWDRILLPDQIVQVGQQVQAKVISLDMQNLRIGLSLRELNRDPLTMTMDSVLPVTEMSYSDIEWEEATEENFNPALKDIIESLQMEEGVGKISLGRQATASKAVSQDLQLYMAKEEVSDGFNLVARGGKWVQEVHVQTQLSRDEFKKSLQKALRRI
eukprot:TRINITY_DN3184_c0_g1_i3.p1 TRINITY_DN3184_c0_g1~~TRINITY_DN3184_c0_g1_i3.p1  ORF type:complete len:344 (-),score=42.51 TRINITY_DN3184_c0_g1_i3:111-1142(-)